MVSACGVQVIMWDVPYLAARTDQQQHVSAGPCPPLPWMASYGIMPSPIPCSLEP